MRIHGQGGWVITWQLVTGGKTGLRVCTYPDPPSKLDAKCASEGTGVGSRPAGTYPPHFPPHFRSSGHQSEIDWLPRPWVSTSAADKTHDATTAVAGSLLFLGLVALAVGKFFFLLLFPQSTTPYHNFRVSFTRHLFRHNTLSIPNRHTLQFTITMGFKDGTLPR